MFFCFLFLLFLLLFLFLYSVLVFMSVYVFCSCLVAFYPVCFSVSVCYLCFCCIFCFLSCCICVCFVVLLFLHTGNKKMILQLLFSNVFVEFRHFFMFFIGFLTCINYERCIFFQLRGFMLDVNHCCNCGSDKQAWKKFEVNHV